MLMESLKNLPHLPLLIALGATGIMAITDVRSFRIPNALTTIAFVGGILYHAVVPEGNGVGTALLGGAAGFAILIVFYVMGGIGAGDVKLMAALGTWLGPQLVFALFIAAALLLGASSLVMALRRGTLQQNLYKVSLILHQGLTIAKHVGAEERVEDVTTQDRRRERLIPFAVMVLGGISLLVAVKLLNP